MARINKTIQDYQQQLEYKGIKNIPDFVQSILDADITKGKYSRFLLDCYLNDKFREEDLEGGLNSTIGQTVSLFHKHKSKLLKDMRSVYKYNSPGSLWSAVKHFDGELSGKEIKKKEQDKIYAETEFLYEDIETGFKIVCPLTEDAAKWWGKGTRWCTSAENNNQFWNYADTSPLLIFLMSDGNKLQLWKHENKIYFMDEADNNVATDYIEQNWDILEPICHWLKDLRFIPDKYKDYTMCLDAIKQNGEALRSIPENFIDYNLCLEAVRQNGFAIIPVPDKFKDYNLYLEAVKQKGGSLLFILKEHRDYNLCLEAVKSNGYALQDVPKKHKDYTICMAAVKQNGGALKFVPKEILDYNLCLEAIKNDGTVLEFIPEKHIDYNIYSKVVKQKEDASRYLSDQKETQEDNHKVIQQIPEKKYEQVFSEIRSYFPEKELSLTM